MCTYYQHQQYDQMLGFIRDLLDSPAACYEEIDTQTMTEFGLKHSIILEVDVTEPCHKDCPCEINGNFPCRCYRIAKWIHAK